MIWILRNEEGRGFIQINGWVCEMNRIQHKKWIDTLGIGLFILTMLYMCGLTSNKDEIEIEQNVVTEDKIQQEADNELPADFPKDLFFNSGVGGWRTYLRLNRDGSFIGEYSDFNAYAENDFPKGTVTICEFEGKFTEYSADGSVSLYNVFRKIRDIGYSGDVDRKWIQISKRR